MNEWVAITWRAVVVAISNRNSVVVTCESVEGLSSAMLIEPLMMFLGSPHRESTVKETHLYLMLDGALLEREEEDDGCFRDVRVATRAERQRCVSASDRNRVVGDTRDQARHQTLNHK